MASLVPRPLPDLSCSRGEPISLKGGEIKSGSGLGTRLATHYAPYEEVTKTLRHCMPGIIENIPIDLIQGVWLQGYLSLILLPW